MTEYPRAVHKKYDFWDDTHFAWLRHATPNEEDFPPLFQIVEPSTGTSNTPNHICDGMSLCHVIVIGFQLVCCCHFSLVHCGQNIWLIANPYVIMYRAKLGY